MYPCALGRVAGYLVRPRKCLSCPTPKRPEHTGSRPCIVAAAAWPAHAYEYMYAASSPASSRVMDASWLQKSQSVRVLAHPRTNSSTSRSDAACIHVHVCTHHHARLPLPPARAPIALPMGARRPSEPWPMITISPCYAPCSTLHVATTTAAAVLMLAERLVSVVVRRVTILARVCLSGPSHVAGRTTYWVSVDSALGWLALGSWPLGPYGQLKV